jgi:hypothetical protein
VAGHRLPYIGDLTYIAYHRPVLMDVQRGFSLILSRRYINDCCIAWSPAGQSILFSDFKHVDSLLAVPFNCTDPCDKAVHPAYSYNGPSQPQRVTTNASLQSLPVASNGRWIAFVSGNTEVSKVVEDENILFVLDSDCIGTEAGCASSIRQIASDLSHSDNLSWSPDGRWLVYVVNVDGTPHLHSLDSTCLEQYVDCDDYIRALPDTPARYVRPVW